MSGNAKDWRFPAACPTCAKTAGTPARLSECTETIIEITVRCGACGAEWTVTSDTPPLFLKRKPDRRSEDNKS
jgi:hypothetical protein